MKSQNVHKSQHGAATLLTALVLLIGITLVTFLSSKTVLVQTQIAADNYRMTQAVAAANAALDFGVGYFDGVVNASGVVVAGFDHDNNKCPDYLSDPLSYFDASTNTTINCAATSPYALTYTSTDGNLVTTATVTFDNDDGTRCVTAGEIPSMKSGLITAVGFSDDGLAQRTMSQCVGTINIFGGNSPKQSMVSRSGVGLTGNYKMINRYYNTTAWSGSAVNIGASASAATYLRPVGTRESDYTRAQLEDSGTGNAWTSQPISDRDKGNGVDTIANDPGLASLISDAFFNNFFYGDRTTMKNLAQSLDQVYPAANVGNADGKSGVVWIEGDAGINGGTYGSADSPVIIIINGNLQASGNPNIIGLLYIRGQLNAAGTVGVLGSVVVEGDLALVPAGEDPVVGHGGVDLVYSPYALDRSANPIVGTTTAISGSWRDW
ncbi:hypothetical protein [Methylobacter psychrophilus]|jgi:hypothetical protein|uniref:hypothetical protein n=1 Tax=Methylobacter psychrophilus TaxID=96941 RepID=UPI0021D519FE|nr:hypothetical protein [Methylobacter psychrophilus]